MQTNGFPQSHDPLQVTEDESRDLSTVNAIADDPADTSIRDYAPDPDDLPLPAHSSPADDRKGLGLQHTNEHPFQQKLGIATDKAFSEQQMAMVLGMCLLSFMAGKLL